MKITAINLQVRDKNRVNLSVDGVFRLSLDIAQLVDLGLKVGMDIDDEKINELKNESEFGKVYGRALEYSLIRPRSKREVGDYLYRKTLSKMDKTGTLRPGISSLQADRVLSRLVDRGYVDDLRFAKHWVENRFLKKGVSERRLQSELSKKGISRDVILSVINDSDRNNDTEIIKIINKKLNKYNDENKLIAYLARQGFNYDDIKSALEKTKEDF